MRDERGYGIVNLLVTLAIVTALAYWMLSRKRETDATTATIERLESQGAAPLPSGEPLPEAVEAQVQKQIDLAKEAAAQRMERLERESESP